MMNFIKDATLHYIVFMVSVFGVIAALLACAKLAAVMEEKLQQYTEFAALITIVVCTYFAFLLIFGCVELTR